MNIIDCGKQPIAVNGCTNLEYDYFLYTIPLVTSRIAFTHPYPLCVIEAGIEVIYDKVSYASLPQITASFDQATGVFNFDTTNETYLGKTLTYNINVKVFT